MKKAATSKRPAKKDTTNYSVSNCSFVGVSFDAKAVDAIQTIAEGLSHNAQALGALADVLRASNVTIETMLLLGKEQ